MKRTKGFTLIELIVVIAVISILSSIVFFNVSLASKKSRDADRQADLRTLQSAIELYKQKYGRYPEGCNGPNQWAGQVGTSYACNRNNTIYTQFIGTGQYIFGHQDTNDWDRDGNSTEIFSFTPEFIPALPTDKKLNGVTSGYVYTTNTAGTVYKLMAKRSVESEVVDYSHPFKSCDVTNSSTGVCDNTVGSGGSTPTHCLENNANFRITYAVWGGFASGPAGTQNGSSEHNTEIIICDIP